ncbi:hypothetical protein ACFT9I_07290 [Streptomyces sp. NPDC057137]|uniref:hypothetical protein n=1 Tax=Streptomyces sp. NPDC057137 TaxID=3346030 RepID=UPI003625EAAF
MPDTANSLRRSLEILVHGSRSRADGFREVILLDYCFDEFFRREIMVVDDVVVDKIWSYEDAAV